MFKKPTSLQKNTQPRVVKVLINGRWHCAIEVVSKDWCIPEFKIVWRVK